jgi:uncharacterized protein YlxP (DUF503 family)
MIAAVREYDYHDVCKKIESLIQLIDTQDNVKMVSIMKELVPEYISNNSEFEVLDKRN